MARDGTGRGGGQSDEGGIYDSKQAQRAADIADHLAKEAERSEDDKRG